MLKEKLKITRQVKIYLISITSILLLLDVYFFLDKPLPILDSPFPTISQVVLFSSPKYMVFIWLFGLFSANFFFPRKKQEVLFKEDHPTFQKSLAYILTGIFAVVLLVSGHKLHKEVSCADRTLVAGQDVPNYIEITCRDFKTNQRLANCQQVYCNKSTEDQAQIMFKYDLVLEYKLLLLIIGFFWGYYVTPQCDEEEKFELVEEEMTHA